MADEISKVVDAKGPVVPHAGSARTKGDRRGRVGQLMLVESTDAGSKSDIPSWTRDMGHELVESETEGPVYHATPSGRSD